MKPEELKALHAAATPGTWLVDHDDGGPHYVNPDSPGSNYSVCSTSSWNTRGAADAALIVAAVNALPGLIAVVEAVKALTKCGGSMPHPGVVSVDETLFDALQSAVTALESEGT